MIRNICLKYEDDLLRNKEVTVKNIFFVRKSLSSRGDKSENIGTRVINLVS
jgi:hypothetical protein